MKTIGRWAYLVGLVVSIVTAVVGFYSIWLGYGLIVLAVLAGLFFCEPKELTNYGIRYLTLFAVAGAFHMIPFVGPIFTDVADAMFSFFGPIILTVLFVFNINQAVEWFKGK